MNCSFKGERIVQKMQLRPLDTKKIDNIWTAKTQTTFDFRRKEQNCIKLYFIINGGNFTGELENIYYFI